MNIVFIVLAVILFFVLSPGVLLRLPKKGALLTVTAVHTVVYGVLLWGVSTFVLNIKREGLDNITDSPTIPDDTDNYKNMLIYHADTIHNSVNTRMQSYEQNAAIEKLVTTFRNELLNSVSNYKIAIYNTSTIEETTNIGKTTPIGSSGLYFLNENGISTQPDTVADAYVSKIEFVLPSIPTSSS